MSDSVRPHRRQPTRLPHPWGSPVKNTGVGCHFLLQCMKVKSEREITQSCPTLSMDCSLPGSSVHGIFQARVLGWGAIAFSITYINRCSYIIVCIWYWVLYHLLLWIPLSFCNALLWFLLYFKVYFVWYEYSYPHFFLFPFAWNIFYHPLTFSLCYLYLWSECLVDGP